MTTSAAHYFRRFLTPHEHHVCWKNHWLLSAAISSRTCDRRNPAPALVQKVGLRVSSIQERAITTTSNVGGQQHNKFGVTTTFSRSVTDPSPCFKVAKVSYDGHLEIVNMATNELLREASILPRELFLTLNVTSPNERGSKHARRTLAAILPREDVIVVSLGNHRVVVGLDRVFLLDAHMPVVIDFAKQLAKAFRSGELSQEHGEPNELVVLERILRDTVDIYNWRLQLYEPIVDSFLTTVANEVYSDTGVHQLVPLKESLLSFKNQVMQSLDCLKDILKDDELMLDVLLTEQAAARDAGREVDFLRHEHVELLLGVYARQFDSILLEINFLLGRLQSKQEFVAIALSGYRNRMIRMDLQISIAGLSLGFGTAVAGVFGMNLISGLEETAGAFGAVVLGSSFVSFLIAVGSLHRLSGRGVKRRDAKRLEDIETLTGALSDMCALDYTIKTSVEQGIRLDKESFRNKLCKARHSKQASDKEIDLLFGIYDNIKDGELSSEDFGVHGPPGKGSQ